MWICCLCLALTHLRYEQEWPLLAEAEERQRQEEAMAAHTILMWICRRCLALARLQYEQEWPLLDEAKDHQQQAEAARAPALADKHCPHTADKQATALAEMKLAATL
jgi:hypothetical protein